MKEKSQDFGRTSTGLCKVLVEIFSLENLDKCKTMYLYKRYTRAVGIYTPTLSILALSRMTVSKV